VVYIYVEEDVETDSIMAERPWWARWLKNHLTLGGIFGDVTRGGFTVYEGELDPEGRLVTGWTNWRAEGSFVPRRTGSTHSQKPGHIGGVDASSCRNLCSCAANLNATAGRMSSSWEILGKREPRRRITFRGSRTFSLVVVCRRGDLNPHDP
jgi:hypothetical protein